MTVQHEITCIAPVNIAVIKYWGKVDTERILPTNESLSVTLNTRDLHTKTTVRADPSYDQDRLWLNGQETDVQKNMRLTACLKELRSMRERMEEETGLDVG
jgi:diphosphomevalonate decarboxylase